MTDEPKRPKKILVVDDDVSLCKLIAAALRSAGYETLTAFSGEGAVEVYRAERPDLVLLDFAMPGMNGFEVVDAVRKLETPDRRAIIVFVTAYSQAFLVSVDFHVGVDGCLTKPILPADLISHVNDLFASHGG
jgi:CheY-like chemotaxis protein